MLKLTDNPPVLLPGVERVANLSGRWWVGHTRARNEKAFAWDMLNHGIGYFLPLVERVTVSSGKKRRALMPLFPSYVFFCGSDEDRYRAMTTNRLCQTIEVDNQHQLVSELGTIEQALAGKATLDLYPHAVEGKRCRVTQGPFRGLEGVVIERRSIARLILQISFISQGAALEIDADLLEPAE
jgi:transcription antitermination factor NusG